jgi:uncharacterized protein YjdB
VRNARFLSLTLVAAISAAGCQSDATAPPAPPADPAPLTVAPSVATLQGGQAVRLIASVHLANGSTTKPEGVKWASADASIASVGPDGTVAAVRAGQVQIVASWEDSRGSSLIVVAEQVRKKGSDCLVNLEEGTGSSIPGTAGCN